ncbi:MAG: phage holin family protein [Myxococcota bacterium]|nr:phage holin family protein [Myxococcota bacterium]
MLVELLVHLIVTAALILVVANLVSGIEVEGWGSAFIGALVLGLVNGLVRPLMVVLTLPLTVITLGLFLFVVNALMLWLSASLVPGIQVRGFGAALVGSIVLCILNLAVTFLFGPIV